MTVYIIRHGETNLNKVKKIQGRVNEPLNETGIAQAKEIRKKLGEIKFDAVYSGPLDRTIQTAVIATGLPESEIIKDERIIESSFGRYDKKGYFAAGLRFGSYWLFPEKFSCPKTMESVGEMKKRVNSFFDELKGKNYNKVLVSTHGNLIRVIRQVLDENPHEITYKDFPDNCEVLIYEI